MSDQNELRDDILRIILPYLERHAASQKLVLEAEIACMGACAVALATIPDKKARDDIARSISKNLPVHADARRKEIMSKCQLILDGTI